MTTESEPAALEKRVADLEREIAELKTDNKELRTLTENLASSYGHYFSGSGKRSRILIDRLYSNGTIDGVVFGSFSGGSFFADSIPMKGKQAHGQPYWEPFHVPKVVEQLTKMIEEEKKAEEAAARGTNSERKIATSTRP